GDKVTLDGATGRVWVNTDVPVAAGGITPEAAALATIAREKATDATMRVTLDPENWPMQLPAQGTVVLDLSQLVKRQRNDKQVRLLLAELKKRTGLTGVLDFTEGPKG